MLQVSGLGPYGPRVCNTCNAIKQGRGDPRECSQTPLKSCAVNSKHSLCNPKPKLTQDEAARKRGQKEIAPIPFLNPNPVVQLVGHANKAPVVMDGCEVAALVDLGAQVLTMSAQLCEELGLKIQPLGQLLELEGTGGAAIPYLRFVEVNLQIPGIRRYNEDVLLLAIPTMAYAERVLVMVGSKIIDKALSCMTAGRANKSNCDLATGSLWSSYVRVTAAIPQQLRAISNAKLIWGK